MRWAGNLACMGETITAWKIVGKCGEKRSLARPRRRWENEICIEGMCQSVRAELMKVIDVRKIDVLFSKFLER
jgi:hypothetical protein